MLSWQRRDKFKESNTKLLYMCIYLKWKDSLFLESSERSNKIFLMDIQISFRNYDLRKNSQISLTFPPVVRKVNGFRKLFLRQMNQIIFQNPYKFKKILFIILNFISKQKN